MPFAIRTVVLAGAISFLVCRPLALVACQAHGPGLGRFSPTVTPPKYERDREYDLKHVAIRLKLSWPEKTFAGSVHQFLAPLRDGLSSLSFDAGPDLRIRSCTVNGRSVRFVREKESIRLLPSFPMMRGMHLIVDISFASAPYAVWHSHPSSDSAFRWNVPDKFDPSKRAGFWTNGWPETNHNWLPIYDYPNDKTESEEIVEVPKNWFVMGNGGLHWIEKGKTRNIFYWQMAKPHSTYLISLTGGEVDLVRERSVGTELLYMLPGGQKALARASFGNTPEMVKFYSQRLGVHFPWPKYGQSAMQNFEIFGGMENVGATTLTETALVDDRDELRGMDGLVAHELAHQWFGDLITYKDWSQAWLSEGFATYFQQLYFEFSQGKEAFDRAREEALQAYLNEAKNYQRPIVTRNYPNPTAMLDSHTYPKAALILHMLRKELGDADFFRALGYYLRKHAYQVVETHDLMRAISEATGRNAEPFFEQWIFKPGHPVISYSWKWDESGKKVILTVSQTQRTDDGVPVYTLNIPIGLLHGDYLRRSYVHLTQASQQFSIPCARKPDAVLLDPDHDLLMERDKTWSAGLVSSVLRYAPSSIDRQSAAMELLSDELGQESFWSSEKEVVVNDSSSGLIVAVLNRVAGMKKAGFRDYFRRFLKHKHSGEQAAAISALAALPKNDDDMAVFRKLINEKERYSVVIACLRALGNWDANGNVATFRRAMRIESHRDVVQVAALAALSNARSDAALDLVLDHIKPGKARPVRKAAAKVLNGFAKWSDRAAQALMTLANDPDPEMHAPAGD